MDFVRTSTIITKKVVNDNTGEIETKDFKEIEKVSKMRGGFNLMYHKSYEEITEEAIKSNKELKLFNWITNQFTYKRVETSLSYLDCKVEISQPVFARFIKLLVDKNYIMRVSRGIYRLNPFIYLPFKADGVELQREWNQLLKQ